MKYILKKSYTLILIFGLIGILAGTSISISGLPGYLVIASLALVVAITVFEIRRIALMASPAAISGFSLDDTGARIWRNTEASADGIHCTLYKQWVLPELVVLKLRDSVTGRIYTLLLVRDMFEDDGFRKLKRRLLLPGKPPVQDSGDSTVSSG